MSEIVVQNNVNIVDVNTKNNQVLVTDPTLPTTVTVDNTITEVVEVITPGPQGSPGDPSILTGSFVNINVYNEFTSSYNTGSFTGSFSGSGAGLTDIPASGIVGLNLSQIISGSVSASISPDSGLQVNTNVTATSFTGSLFGTASFAQTSSFSLSGNGNFTGSFTGSFTGDGSQLTGIVSSKWSGSNPITRDSDVEITGSLRVSGSIDVTDIVNAVLLSGSLRTDKISFTQQGPFTGVQGDLGYSFDDGKFTFYIENDIPIELGQTLYARVRNADTVILTKGTIVDFTSDTVGQTPRVKRAIATSGSDCSCFVGIVLQDIGVNEFGAIMLNGVARGLNLTSFNTDDQLYLSATVSGSATTVIPIPPIKAIRIGKVLNASTSPTQGVLYVRPENRTVYFDLDQFKQTYNTGSFTGSFTGSLEGTSSWAVNAQTASFITGSDVFGPFGSNSIISASFAVSASRAISSSFATTSSFAVSSSRAISSSFAQTANIALNVPTQTSQLVNNGQNGVDPFVDNQNNLVIKLEYSWDNLSLDPDTATDLDIELAIQNQIEGFSVDERQHLYIVVVNGDAILNIFTFNDPGGLITTNDLENLMNFALDNPTIESLNDITTITFTNLGYTIPREAFENSRLIYIKSYAIEIGLDSFKSSADLEEIDFPILEIIGDTSFRGCGRLNEMNLPSVISYGNTTGNEGVFASIVGNAIQITTPIIHQTSNGGNLEGDLQELDGNNAVTFNWI
jgi:hypothetical protein